MDLLNLAAKFTIDKADYDRAIEDAYKSAQDFGENFDNTADDISGSISSLEDDYDDLSDAMQDTASEAENMDGSLSGLSDSMSDAVDEASNLESAASDAASGMSDAADGAETLSYSFGEIEGGSADANESLFNLGDMASMVAGIFTGDFVGAIAGGVDKVSELATAVWDGVSALAEYGDNIDKSSQKMGISSDAYQEWDAVMQHSGTTIDSMRKGMMKISTAMDEVRAASKKTIDVREVEKTKNAYENAQLGIVEANKKYEKAAKKYGENSLEAQKALQGIRDANYKAYEAQMAYEQAMEGTSAKIGKTATALQSLGINVEDAGGNLRSQEEVFKEVIFALQDIDDASRRAALAQDIFGMSAMELGPLLNTSTEDTQAMINRVHELGGVMSEDAVKASATFQDTLQDFNTAVTGFKNMLLEVLLPVGIYVLNALTNFIVGWRNIFQGVGQAVESVVQGITDFFTNTFGNLVSNAAKWGKDMIDNFIGGIKSMWDKAKGAVSDFAGMIKNFLGFSEPDEGPLSNFHTYAPDMVKLFAQGIEDSKGMISGAIEDAFALPEVSQSTGSSVGQEVVVPRGDSDEGRDMTIIFKLADDTELGRAVYRLYNNANQNAGLKIAGVM